MKETNLIKTLEIISSEIPNRLLKLEGYLYKENKKEKLEIIIYKGFSSSTTHPIEMDLEKKVISYDHFFTNFKLFEAPLKKNSEDFIRENTNSVFFIKKENWI